jgi:hypothetical protein
MTSYWWTPAPEVAQLIAVDSGRMSERKARLLGVAFASDIVNFVAEPEIRDGIAIAERFADGLATDDERRDARNRAEKSIPDYWNYRGALPFEVIRHSYSAVAGLNYRDILPNLTDAVRDARSALISMAEQSQEGFYRNRLERLLIDEIFALLFRPVALDPRWLSASVLDLSCAIYEERAFERMPILADALMDAGCDNDDILNHCRGDGPHVRGCWVVDLLLGKE